MNTEQEVEEMEKTIPNGEYTDRDLQNSRYGPNQPSNASKKVAMKPESKNKVKGQYKGYRRRSLRKLKRKDQEIDIYQRIIESGSSSLTQLNINDLKRRIAEVENDKEIIIKNEERYFNGRFYRYGVTPLKLVGKFFATIVSKLRDWCSVIDIDMDFDQQSAEDMLNVGFNNSEAVSQPQEQTTQSVEQSELVQGEPPIQKSNINQNTSSLTIPLENLELPLSTEESDYNEFDHYSVFDNGGDELATLEDINRLNQKEKVISAHLNSDELDDDIDKVLEEIAQVYNEEKERQQKLKTKADEHKKQEAEAKKQAEEAAEKERKAKAAEVQTNKLVRDATEEEQKERANLQLKLKELRERVNEIKEQNENLESTIVEASTNIDQYEENRRNAEINATKILNTVQENYSTINKSKAGARQMSEKAAELDKMLEFSNKNEPVQPKFSANQSVNSRAVLGENELDVMLSRFNQQSTNPNLNLDHMLENNGNTQETNFSIHKGKN